MNIQTYRKEKGLSQQAFADLLTAGGSPASQGLVSQWEQGKVEMTAKRARAIVRITDGEIGMDDLFPVENAA